MCEIIRDHTSHQTVQLNLGCFMTILRELHWTGESGPKKWQWIIIVICGEGSFRFHFQVSRDKCQYFQKLFWHKSQSTSETLLMHWLKMIYFCNSTSYIVLFAKVLEPVIFSFLSLVLWKFTFSVSAPLNESDKSSYGGSLPPCIVDLVTGHKWLNFQNRPIA